MPEFDQVIELSMSCLIDIAREEDAAEIHQLWLEADEWLRSLGPPMWYPDEITREVVEKYVERGILSVARQNDAISGTFTYEIEDPIFWPEIASGHSAYVHRLIISRKMAGTGLSKEMLDSVVARARREGRNDVRLDCGAKREKLRAFYERYGFTLVEVKPVGRFYSALYRLPLR